MKLAELKEQIIAELTPLYGKREAKNLSFIIIEEQLDILKDKFYSYTENILKNKDIKDVYTILKRLKNKEPIQYIFGHTWFWDMKLHVTPDVLIPRPETEELSQLIINEYKNSTPKILDIGTGSGCIALALKKGIPRASVEGIDVSENALKVAQKNATEQNLDVNFYRKDIMESDLSANYDVFVSNPPYVTEDEIHTLDEHVKRAEPEIALFTRGKDPLLFYKHTLDVAKNHLNAEVKFFLKSIHAMLMRLLYYSKKKGFQMAKFLKILVENKGLLKEQ